MSCCCNTEMWVVKSTFWALTVPTNWWKTISYHMLLHILVQPFSFTICNTKNMDLYVLYVSSSIHSFVAPTRACWRCEPFVHCVAQM
jgi:hypothetical protein